ncbi:MAG: tRNA (adenosine(37)-N6)-threonylcarbamoyltransferase complex transferase subunit TsaD [Clostridiales Family XIII bacterium]|jgi:N6-L-threonylcarbamoyladenine synthase|nr:tRNA (adenosine(37)-N6)-threonylcarbamoyltransferase complex transferase subunit TsaD [Clostridiales Family XIII bacterium]
MKIDRELLTLGIETSCDETSASVTRGGRHVLSNVISSQIHVHEAFGGVVPEIASRHHLTQINAVIDTAMKDAGVAFPDLDLIGVTEGPGLVGAVLIGLSTAKAMALALDKPLVGVHHIKGHICAAYLEHEELSPPLLSLVVSGGHTYLIDVRDHQNFEILGRTRDDAVGEAFDKVARVLGLGYPGGPKVDEAARRGNPEAVAFKRVMLEKDSLDFSFSGIKTGVLNYVNTERQAGRPINLADVAASFQASVVDVVVAKTQLAIDRAGYKTLTVGGGVASNSLLRRRLTEACDAAGVKLYIPSPIFCTDNAAMIACAAHCDYIAGKVSSLNLDAKANFQL